MDGWKMGGERSRSTRFSSSKCVSTALIEHAMREMDKSFIVCHRDLSDARPTSAYLRATTFLRLAYASSCNTLSLQSHYAEWLPRFVRSKSPPFIVFRHFLGPGKAFC